MNEFPHISSYIAHYFPNLSKYEWTLNDKVQRRAFFKLYNLKSLDIEYSEPEPKQIRWRFEVHLKKMNNLQQLKIEINNIFISASERVGE